MAGKSPTLSSRGTEPNSVFRLGGLDQKDRSQSLGQDGFEYGTGMVELERASRQVSRQILRHRMIRPGDHVLAAFSGGADSTALVLILLHLGHRLTLAHIDHGMRSDSALDAFHASATARRLGLRVETARVAVSPATEAAARAARYQALERMREKAGAACIATGHTADDDAETVKMRLERGGFGLGIPPVRGAIVRPILTLAGHVTEAVCREAGVLYLQDPSNRDLRFTRNRIRASLAKAPRSRTRALLTIGERARARAEAVGCEVARQAGAALHCGPGVVLVDRGRLTAAPPPVSRGLIRLAGQVAGIELTARLVEDIREKVVARSAPGLDLPGGLRAWNEGPHLVLGRRRRSVPARLPEIRICAQGRTLAEGWNLQIDLKIEPGAQEDVVFGQGPLQEVFDADRLLGPLTLRQWQPGDRIRPLGTPAGKGKKLQDLFVDEKVPRPMRHTTPLLLCGDRVFWVVGHRIDDRFKVTASTRRLVTVSVGPCEGRPVTGALMEKGGILE